MKTETLLRNLYKKFLRFYKTYYMKDVKNWLGVEKLKLSKKTLDEVFENYQKDSFLDFVGDVKDIIYSRSVFDFILKNSVEDWDLWYYLKFLEKEKVIRVKRDGRAVLLKKELLKVIPKPQTEKEIKSVIEKKLKLKVRNEKPVVDLFKKFRDFKVKAEWDQMPISQGSAIFTASKILEDIPLNKKFLFVGDDDFMSVVLTLADPGIECLVIDIDDKLLECIDILASKFNLKIETRKVDIAKEKHLGEKFIGFLTSPVYTVEGVKQFVKYGVNQFGRDGGQVFLNFGDESIGNRFLFLQEFFTKENLIIDEIISKKTYYPWISLHAEDRIIDKRLFSMIDRKTVQKSPKIGTSLILLKYLPFKINKLKIKKSMYAYL